MRFHASITRAAASLVLTFTLCLSLSAQDCPLPPSFDAGAIYNQTLVVSPDGDDSAVGTIDEPLRTIEAAARLAAPGTEILLRNGEHVPGQFLTELHGTSEAPIRIRGESREGVRFSGGTEAIHLIDPAYVVLESLTVTGASGNGINIDDGGSYETPAHHVVVRDVTVRDIGPMGNRDGIKLSGLDQFRIEGCLIERGGSGGSGIDMVGCHDGLIAHNTMQDMGSSGIQAKGGTARITIYANQFIDSGMRAINMGGSTGLQFFRPIDAPYEAASITVWANVFKGGDTPVAFVGCENGLFAHNVVIRPIRWAARILQETVGERFVPAQNNVIANNIFVLDSSVNTLVNVGPNTAPDTFRFYANAWGRDERPIGTLSLPGDLRQNLVDVDPAFVDSPQEWALSESSTLLGAGIPLTEVLDGLPIPLPQLGDAEGRCFADPPDIGVMQSQAMHRAWRLDN